MEPPKEGLPPVLNWDGVTVEHATTCLKGLASSQGLRWPTNEREWTIVVWNLSKVSNDNDEKHSRELKELNAKYLLLMDKYQALLLDTVNKQEERLESMRKADSLKEADPDEKVFGVRLRDLDFCVN